MKQKQGLSTLSTLLTAAAVSFAGCGSDDPATGPAAGSCNFVSSGGITTCYEYYGSGYTTATAQTACSNLNSGGTATYSTSACPTTDRVGSCRIRAGQPTEEYIRYLTGNTSDAAEATCTVRSGTYTAG